jgi:hypothetical protein
MHLITRSDLDEETVYQVVKTIYEQRDAVIERHPAGRAIGPGAARDVGTPFHPGAVRYYREIGVGSGPGEPEPGESGSGGPGPGEPESGG